MKTGNRTLVVLSALCTSILWGMGAAAAQDQIVVGPGTVSGSQGRVAINVAAGTSNQQAAQTSIALGDAAAASGSLQQVAPASLGDDPATMVTVAPGAFTGNSGLLSINISAGRLNQSANLSQLAVGKIVAMSDQLLEQSRASTEPSGSAGGAASTTNDTVALADTAFGDNSGLVQLNLIGGARNSSANIFQLSMSAGSHP